MTPTTPPSKTHFPHGIYGVPHLAGKWLDVDGDPWTPPCPPFGDDPLSYNSVIIQACIPRSALTNGNRSYTVRVNTNHEIVFVRSVVLEGASAFLRKEGALMLRITDADDHSLIGVHPITGQKSELGGWALCRGVGHDMQGEPEEFEREVLNHVRLTDLPTTPPGQVPLFVRLFGNVTKNHVPGVAEIKRRASSAARPNGTGPCAVPVHYKEMLQWGMVATLAESAWGAGHRMPPPETRNIVSSSDQTGFLEMDFEWADKLREGWERRRERVRTILRDISTVNLTVFDANTEPLLVHPTHNTASRLGMNEMIVVRLDVVCAHRD